MVGREETTMFHRDLHPDGRPVKPEEREQLLRKVLPPTSYSDETTRSTSPKPVGRKRRILWSRFVTRIHLILFAIIQAVFSIYLRSRYLYHVIIDRIYTIMYYPHRTPEYIRRDVKALSRLPTHISVILDLHSHDRYDADSSLENLVNDVCEICAWTASAGIPVLTIYERTGILKEYLQDTHRAITQTLRSYYGQHPPSISLRAPHLQSISPPRSPNTLPADATPPRLEVTLISKDDGRATLVDLTKTFAEMAQNRKIGPEHVTGELIEQELSDLTMKEPDLLILFGPNVQLQGYPPWQLRLTEIFNVEDHQGVAYHVFLRALHCYGKAQMRFGR
ncbi:di-cis-decaprenylcistransferase [Viridothelium virens]|uniref:ditrans,polycis-polyprenyl diphosphate synthase [(2E,6E)-farnesyldiphosphate specific] n=1 Tax=Viridothelium virens TaxID=1048519 RepID=A0A6A6HJ08_VIRVR|nr:di-cis-decaprenylcistransferase [Viridothelium virens]